MSGFVANELSGLGCGVFSSWFCSKQVDIFPVFLPFQRKIPDGRPCHASKNLLSATLEPTPSW